PQQWARQTGSVPTASFTITKLRWLAERQPAAAARPAHVLLPHDWLTWRLADRPAGGPTTDRGDASGTGYFSPATGRWLPEMAEAALGRPVGLPRLATPAEIVGRTAAGAALSAGTRDNMGAALGPSLDPGGRLVSLGPPSNAYAGAGTGATSSSPSAPQVPRARSPPERPPTRPVPWPVSPMPPGTSCRWRPR